jgi:hypothetical protein
VHVKRKKLGRDSDENSISYINNDGTAVLLLLHINKERTCCTLILRQMDS